MRPSLVPSQHDAEDLLDFMENAGVGLRWIGPDGRILWANRADYEPFGYTAEEYIGHHVSEFHADQAKLAELVSCMENGLPIKDVEASIRCKDGSVRDVMITSSVRRSEQGEFLHTRCITVDVSERKRDERERSRMTEELMRVADFRERLLGIVAHDLRNPLGAIAVGTQYLMQSETISERDQNVVRRIARSTERMTRMIADLLDFAHGRLVGGINVKVAPMDLGEVAHRIVDEFDMANTRRILFGCQGTMLGCWDETRVSQVISNLVGNAIKHGEDPVFLRLRDEGDTVVMTVGNRGKPIEPAELAEIFVPFRRSDMRSEGLGLGLYIVSEIVRAHSGTIEVTSTAQEGTIFTVRWPRDGGRKSS